MFFGVLTLMGLVPIVANAQGTFQNLDFENGTFIPIPGQLNTVEFAAAMPGRRGYLGTNQIAWILHNDQFIDTAGISIYGPDNPSADYLHGHYFLLLKKSSDSSMPKETAVFDVYSCGYTRMRSCTTTARSFLPSPVRSATTVSRGSGDSPPRPRNVRCSKTCQRSHSG